MENVSEKLYNLLGTKFNNTKIKTLTSVGKETTDMEEVEMMSFDFIVDSKNYGPIVILMNNEENLEVYYGDNTSRALDRAAKQKWENLIEHLSIFSRSNRMGFNLKNTSELKYNLSNLNDITEAYKHIFEGYYGTKKTSYNKQGNAKIIIKHSRSMTAEDKRYRHISSLFVENADGERFKLPFTKLTGARAMARHVTEGGNPYDLFGLHISEMVKDINTLGGFVRRSKMFEDDADTKGLVETGRTHYTSLRKGLKTIAGKRGYHVYKEGWEPSEITEQDTDTDAIRKLFTEKSVNQRVSEALPLLARLQKLAELHNPMATVKDEPQIDNDDEDEFEMKELTEFENWANDLVEGNWASPDKIADLKAFMSIEQPLGIDAMNVTDQLNNIIGDDDLFDTLSREAAEDPEMDARVFVMNWVEQAYKEKETYNDTASIERMYNEIKGVHKGMGKHVDEELNNELDADRDADLHSSLNKDMDRHCKDDCNEADDLKELLSKTNFLLKK